MISKIPGNIRGARAKLSAKHPYLSGNFAPLPVTSTLTSARCTYVGEIPKELFGGQYVRNGSNPIDKSTVSVQDHDYHWFDGDGMLAGVFFETRPSKNPGVLDVSPIFTSQFILTDLALNSLKDVDVQTTGSYSLWSRLSGRVVRNRGPILPSMATLVNPQRGLFAVMFEILRSVILIFYTWIAGAKAKITKISVANTGIYFHDGRALATCESGIPVRVHLPGLRTVGWFDGQAVKGEDVEQLKGGYDSRRSNDAERFGGTGPLRWMREWTTGHPKVDPATGEMIVFHNSLFSPYVRVSVLVPEKAAANSALSNLMNKPVPKCGGARMRHDFGVSSTHTVIVDVPLSLDPAGLLRNKPVVEYKPWEPARFGVFPRREPDKVKWFETGGCCIFHTANTWDEHNHDGDISAVNLLACRMTAASMVYNAGNIIPPPPPGKVNVDKRTIETSEIFEKEQCRLYYYRFSLASTDNEITDQFALSPIPFEFPTLNPAYDMGFANFIYGCSTTAPSFTSALGKGTKIDVLVKMNVRALLDRSKDSKSVLSPDSCVDNRFMDEILASRAPDDCIKAFRLPDKHYAQEARFVSRDAPKSEDDGYLLFYVFDENQLHEEGECPGNATSELWILDAVDLATVVAKVVLPTRVPYGLHGNWFDKDKIQNQRGVQQFRRVTKQRGTGKGETESETTPLLAHLSGDDA